MNVFLQTGDKVKFKIKGLQARHEGYVQISRGGNGVHYTEDGEHKIVNFDDITLIAVKRKGQGEWKT